MRYFSIKLLVDKGFALPTVIISSVIMMTILLASIASTVSVRTAVQAQYYESLARAAADAGAEYAKACFDNSGDKVTWTSGNPLRPNTNCSGIAVGGQSPYVLSNSNVRTSFSVGVPELNENGQIIAIKSSGSAEILRVSTGAVWKTFNASSSETISIASSGVHAVIYDAAGGTGAPDGGFAEFGEQLIVGYAPTRSGYSFTGWADDFGAIFQPNAIYSINGPTTFTAQWSQLDATLSFNLNGGSGTFNPITSGVGSNVTIPSSAPSRSGYVFSKWQGSNGSDYQPGASVSLTNNITLTAQWVVLNNSVGSCIFGHGSLTIYSNLRRALLAVRINSVSGSTINITVQALVDTTSPGYNWTGRVLEHSFLINGSGYNPIYWNAGQNGWWSDTTDGWQGGVCSTGRSAEVLASATVNVTAGNTLSIYFRENIPSGGWGPGVVTIGTWNFVP
jgi:uncharacterized repeat protein (TIGR02543 family)